MMNPTSKNTGIATKNPVIIRADVVLFSPNLFSKYLANASAPPECSKIAPNIAPKPTTTATKPNVLPIPSLMVLTISKGCIPAKIPTKILAIRRAINA